MRRLLPSRVPTKRPLFFFFVIIGIFFLLVVPTTKAQDIFDDTILQPDDYQINNFDNHNDDDAPKEDKDAMKPWRFVSIPDFLNADIGDISHLSSYDQGENSTNPWHEEAIASVLQSIAKEEPEFVLVAGDLVNGHWNKDEDGRQIFGSVDTLANQAAAIRNAAHLYYATWRQRFAQHGLLQVHAAIGDHELGDNNWKVGSDKSQLVKHWRRAWAHHFTMTEDDEGQPRYAQRPPAQSQHEYSAYAFQHRNVLVITVDVFHQQQQQEEGKNPHSLEQVDGTINKQGSVWVTVTDDQLAWLQETLAKAAVDPSIHHVIVQGHVPVLYPVRSQQSTKLKFFQRQNSSFWQTLMQYNQKVDLYLAGEMHDMTASNYGGVEQVVHGGILGYARNANYLVVTVHPDHRLELELKWVQLQYSPSFFDYNKKDSSQRLWQVGSNRPRRHYWLDPRGFQPAGTLTIDKSSSSATVSGNKIFQTVYKNRAGFFQWYGIHPDDEPSSFSSLSLLIHLPLDIIDTNDTITNGGTSGPFNNGQLFNCVAVPGPLSAGLTFFGDSRVVAGVSGISGNQPRTTSAWIQTIESGQSFLTVLTLGSYYLDDDDGVDDDDEDPNSSSSSTATTEAATATTISGAATDTTTSSSSQKKKKRKRKKGYYRNGTKWDLGINLMEGGILELDVGRGRLQGIDSPPLNDGAWHHVAVTLPSGGESLSDVKLFVDAKQLTSFVIANGNSINQKINTLPQQLILGHSADRAFHNPFFGSMDDIAVWNRGMHAAEIAAMVELAKTPVLAYNASVADLLFQTFRDKSSVEVQGRKWRYVSWRSEDDKGISNTLERTGDRGFLLRLEQGAGLESDL